MSDVSATPEEKIPPSFPAEALYEAQRPFMAGAVLAVRSAVDSAAGHFAAVNCAELPIDPVRLARIAAIYSGSAPGVRARLNLLELRMKRRSDGLTNL